MSRKRDERKSGNLFVFDASWSRMQPLFVHSAEFGEGPRATFYALPRYPDAVAGVETFHGLARLDYGAREIATENVGKGKLCGNHPGPDVNVDGIHIDGRDFYEAFGATGFGRGQVAVHNDFGRAGLIDEGGFHDSLRTCCE